MNIATAVLGLALAGLIVSIYFTLAYYGRVRSEGVIPSVATEGVCLSILDTPYSHVIGLPNSLFGIGYYTLVILSAGYRLISGEWTGLALLAALSLFAALLSLYLAWALLFKVRAVCPLCFLSQAINIILAVIFTCLVISG